jgi:hypothetical protein
MWQARQSALLVFGDRRNPAAVVWASWQLPHSTRRAPAAPKSFTLVGSGVWMSLAGVPWPVIDAS